MWWAFSALCEYAEKHKKYSDEPKGRGFESLLARQNKSFGCLNRSFYFFVHFNILHARGTRTRREEQSDGRKQSGGLFSPTGQRAEGEAIGAGNSVIFGNDFQI